ncbi:MAG: 3-isopropylmalate dehydratase large subunit [Phycisphaerae bacterium]|nr:3-isopropylmalate dehydratase large subunit [Phycisphaerae bacterium]
MGMTITERILAAHAGRDSVSPGENIWVNVDTLMTHDVCGPPTIGIFREQFGRKAKVFDPRRVVIIPDHYIFTADENAHRNIALLREFAAEQGLVSFYDADFVNKPGVPTGYRCTRDTCYSGVCHSTLAEKGHCRPGEVMLGTDSHTCTAGAFGQFATGIGNTEAAFVLGTGKLWLKVPPTMRFRFEGRMPEYLMAKDLILAVIGEIGTDGATYRAMEFVGSTIDALSIEERMTVCNMAIEAGGKNGIMAADIRTAEYLSDRTDIDYRVFRSDEDAEFLSTHDFDTEKLEPTIAQPHSPGNRATARELSSQKIDRSYIGSCTGGKLTDLLAAARVLRGRKVRVDTFIVPATVTVDRQMDQIHLDGKSVRQVFQDAGCHIGPPSCAACLGGPIDTFGRANEPLQVVSTTNRNFPGRMGHKQAGIFLASPLTAAASALTGRITDPREMLQ